MNFKSNSEQLLIANICTTFFLPFVYDIFITIYLLIARNYNFTGNLLFRVFSRLFLMKFHPERKQGVKFHQKSRENTTPGIAYELKLKVVKISRCLVLNMLSTHPPNTVHNVLHRKQTKINCLLFYHWKEKMFSVFCDFCGK